MGLSAATIRMMADMGLTLDQIIALAEQIDGDASPQRTSAAIRQARYRERLGVSSTEWETIRAQVIARDGNTCRWCKMVADPICIDHVMPLIMSGTNELSNLAVSCFSCNAAKSGQHPNEWIGGECL